MLKSKKTYLHKHTKLATSRTGTEREENIVFQKKAFEMEKGQEIFFLFCKKPL